MHDFKGILKLFFWCTIALALFVLSFYPLELWLGAFFLDLIPSFLHDKNLWIILFGDAFWLMIGGLFLTAFTVFFQIIQKA